MGRPHPGHAEREVGGLSTATVGVDAPGQAALPTLDHDAAQPGRREIGRVDLARDEEFVDRADVGVRRLR
jgi:hypothetical protein